MTLRTRLRLVAGSVGLLAELLLVGAGVADPAARPVIVLLMAIIVVGVGLAVANGRRVPGRRLVRRND
jgi:hypothetical protein